MCIKFIFVCLFCQGWAAGRHYAKTTRRHVYEGVPWMVGPLALLARGSLPMGLRLGRPPWQAMPKTWRVIWADLVSIWSRSLRRGKSDLCWLRLVGGGVLALPSGASL